MLPKSMALLIDRVMENAKKLFKRKTFYLHPKGEDQALRNIGQSYRLLSFLEEWQSGRLRLS